MIAKSSSEDIKPDEKADFEKSFARLEQILELMNSGSVGLDESLKLYEEADKLITQCSKRLNDAERKIEMLIKNRNGEISLGMDQKPATKNLQDN